MHWEALQLVTVGLVSAFANTVAGGGSFISLPVLIFMGVPPVVANGTNRVGVLVQNAAAVAGFRRHRLMKREDLLTAALPATLGAALGAWLATLIDDDSFRHILSVLMVVISLVTYFSSKPQSDESRTAMRGAWVPAGFFVVGIYGGFVQAGVGFFLLALTTLAGQDLVRGNAIKVLAGLFFTIVSLAIFSFDLAVDWQRGAWLALGSIGGALLGVRATVLKGHRWVKGMVTVLIIVFAVMLWL